MLKLAASALGASLLLATPASADGWGRPGWGGGWGPRVGWVGGGGGGCCSPCGGGCGVGFAPVVSYQPVVVVGGGCGGWGGGCGAGWGPGWGPAGWGGGWGYGAPGWGGGAPGWGGGWGYGAPGWGGGAPGWGGGWGYGAPGRGGGWGHGAPGWGGGYGWSAGHGRGYSMGPAYAHSGHSARVARASYGFGPGVRVTRVTRVGIGTRPGIVRAGFRR